MPETARLFFAVQLPAPDSLRKVLEQLGGMGRAVKPVAAEKLHVTLQFLGETDLEFVPLLEEALESAVGARERFEAKLVGLGAFPHERRPSVVWVGVENAATLIEIAAELRQRAEELGFPPENRAFQPHLTLARVRSRPPKDLRTLIEEGRTTEFGSVPVGSIELIRSELTGEGPRYTVLKSVELSEPAGA